MNSKIASIFRNAVEHCRRFVKLIFEAAKKIFLFTRHTRSQHTISGWDRSTFLVLFSVKEPWIIQSNPFTQLECVATTSIIYIYFVGDKCFKKFWLLFGLDLHTYTHTQKCTLWHPPINIRINAVVIQKISFTINCFVCFLFLDFFWDRAREAHS